MIRSYEPDRLIVVRVGTGWQATARLGARWTVGDITADEVSAINSAKSAFSMEHQSVIKENASSNLTSLLV